MPLEPLSPAAFAFIAQVEEAFATLLRSAGRLETSVGETGLGESGFDETGLGGKLLYAGDLDEPARIFTVAANIAGAATLAASADPSAARQAMRDGVVDFLVNSLDEALRILKNQVRKREPVAVCVSVAADSIEREMRARGVVSDLSFSEDFTGAHVRWKELTGEPTRKPHDHGTPVESHAPGQGGEVGEGRTWFTWRVCDAPALWLPKLDALALDSLSPEDGLARRWIERAPRYLGRLAHNARTLHITQQQTAQILARFGTAGIGVPVEITLGPWGDSHAHPPAPASISSVPQVP
jgi:hypothetical protein